MRSISNIEKDIANIPYEIENNINNPQSDFKGFRMSDYIKPQKITNEKIATEEETIINERVDPKDFEVEKIAVEKITKRTLKKEDPKVQEEYKKNYGIKEKIKDKAIGVVGETATNAAAYGATNKILKRKVDIKPFMNTVKKNVSDNKTIIEKINRGLKPGESDALLKTIESNKSALKASGKNLAKQMAPAAGVSMAAGGVVKYLNKKRVEKKKQDILNKARQKYQ